MGANKLHSITKMSPVLLVAELERSIEFFTGILDFEIEFIYEDFYAGMIRDSYSIHLKVTEPANLKKLNNEELNLLFKVNKIEEVYQGMMKKSIMIVQELRLMPYGKEFYISDPDNNLIGIVE